MLRENKLSKSDGNLGVKAINQGAYSWHSCMHGVEEIVFLGSVDGNVWYINLLCSIILLERRKKESIKTKK